MWSAARETKAETSRYLKKKKLGKKGTQKLIEDMELEMREAAKELDFERAAQLRDMILELKAESGS